ncbi:MAG: hypothetical protein LC713_05435 [Actinobacteria bacterium]|nr:hypothetical protein [Actinomycetota bacterium]
MRSPTRTRMARWAAVPIALAVALAGLGLSGAPAGAVGLWTQETGATHPGKHDRSAMTYDEANSKVVLFGGGGGNETWTHTGSGATGVWAQQSPATSPPARTGASMAYYNDTSTTPSTKRVVLFGGLNTATGTAVSDTWTWNGTTWANSSPSPTTLTNTPPARWGAAMAWDRTTAHNTLVLFGGIDATGSVLGDTWTWNGTTWANVSPASSPQARAEASMAWDGDEIVLFGGRTQPLPGRDAPLDDTWTWNGTTWTPQPAAGPGPRWGAGMVFDKPLVDTAGLTVNSAVLFGGKLQQAPPPGGPAGVYYNDTWRWTGTTNSWTLDHPGFVVAQVVAGSAGSPTTTVAVPPSSPIAPDGRYAMGMAYDSSAATVVMFGGTNVPALDDTWDYQRPLV